MPASDLVIRGGKVVTPSGTLRAAVSVRSGRIERISSDESVPRAARVIDAEGLYLLPGIIDAHVHLRDPGLTYKEDFATGTAAAAAGGVTLVMDMPNTIPPTEDADSLGAKAAQAESKAVVDYGIYGLVGQRGTGEIAALARAGVIGFKCYMAETTGKLPPPSDEEMLKGFAAASRAGLGVSVHAEDGVVVRRLIEELREGGRVSPRDHYESRPALAEEKAVAKAILFAGRTSTRLNIAHISSEGGIALVRRAKRRRAGLSAETAPHYLLLDDRDYGRLGSLMKINPSIKTASDRSALWRGLSDGTIDTIATDHSPHTLQEKRNGNIFEAASGFPGLETSVPLMLTQVKRGLLSLGAYARLSSENPAKIWGVYPRKGAIAPGSDADITIVDLKARSRVDPARFYSKAKWSPFEGAKVEGLPVYTISRGRVVMEDGIVETKPGGLMISPGARSRARRRASGA